MARLRIPSNDHAPQSNRGVSFGNKLSESVFKGIPSADDCLWLAGSADTGKLLSFRCCDAVAVKSISHCDSILQVLLVSAGSTVKPSMPSITFRLPRVPPFWSSPLMLSLCLLEFLSSWLRLCPDTDGPSSTSTSVASPPCADLEELSKGQQVVPWEGRTLLQYL